MVRKIKARKKSRTANAKPGKAKKAARKPKSAKAAGRKAAKTTKRKKKKKAVSRAEAIARDNFAYGMGFLIP
jgi:hypothetical protein